MLPETLSSAEKETFESVLSAMTMMQQQQVEEMREPTAPPIAREREVIPPPAEMEPEAEEEDKSTSAKISKGIAIGKCRNNNLEYLARKSPLCVGGNW